MAEPVPEPVPAQGPDSVERLEDEAVRQRLERLDTVLDRVEQVPGPTSDAAMESVQLLTEVYGEALARLLDLGGPALAESCVDDELLGHLLALHDLHPGTVEQRVLRVLEELRPGLEGEGVSVELAGLEAGVARLRVTGGGGCGGCSSGSVDEVLSDSVLALAPELAGVEPVHEQSAGSGQALIPVEALLRRPADLGGIR